MALIKKAQCALKLLNAVDKDILPEDNNDEDIGITIIQKPTGAEDKEEEEEQEVLKDIGIPSSRRDQLVAAMGLVFAA
ncbi:hypothetical protein NW767_014496 [Fusarium falciforme]|nr:hypothetical protein NW767_014496 [Fusarium falciforme]